MEDKEFGALIEEYKICREEASRMESHIWTTSTILGLSSGAGLLINLKAELQSQEHFYLITALAALVIAASMVWWRLSRRWWSIQHLKFRRMNAIEQRLGFQQNSLVVLADLKAMAHVRAQQTSGRLFTRICSRVSHEIPSNIDPQTHGDISNYEYRGNQPVLRMLVATNVIVWICTVLAMAMPHNVMPQTASAILAFFLFILLYWRKP